MIVNSQLLEKYYDGLCTPEEKKAVVKWIKEGEDIIKDYPFPANFDKSTVEETLWSALSTQLDITQPKKRTYNFKRYISIAATLFIILGTYLYLQKTDQQSPHKLTLVYKKIIVPFGKKATITLPDLTVVNLNSGTIFFYPENFSGKNRTVRIIGEGYFNVTKDSIKPFIVETANTTTKVLGTKFNLKAYPEDSETSLVLSSGRVQFSSHEKINDSVIIYPGEKVIYQNHRFSKSKVDPVSYRDWMDNKLRFENTSLSEVIEVLQRWYNVKISLKNQTTADVKLTGSFDNPSLSSLLKDISYTLGIKYTKDKGTIIISE